MALYKQALHSVPKYTRLAAMGGSAPKQKPPVVTENEREAVVETIPERNLSTKDKILLIGGTGASETSIEVYNPDDPGENELFEKQLGALGRHGHTAAVIDHKIYIIGSSGMFPESTVVYDAQTLQKSDGPELSEGRKNAAATVHDGSIFVFGGVDCSSVELLRPDRDKWSTICEMTQTRHDATAVSLGRQIYLIGGVEGGRTLENATRSVSIFTPNSKWKEGPKLQYRRTLLGSVATEGKIIITGGTDQNGEMSSRCWRFDPREKKWQEIGRLNEARAAHSMVNFKGKLLVLGGKNAEKRSLHTVEEYDDRNDAWRRVTPDLLTERAAFAAVTVSGGD